MKQTINLIGIFLFSFILMSCAAGRYPYPTSELSHEGWRQQIETDSNQWALKADQWFLTGGETPAELQNQQADYADAISHESVRVPNFHSIHASGDFQVQIVGEPNKNSVRLVGPNMAVRAIAITVRDNVLCLEQAEDAPTNMDRVVVRISVQQLKALAHKGSGRVEGIRLFTDNLTIESSGRGSLFLAGHINVKCIVAKGLGSVNVFTVRANDTEIETSGSGEVNVSALRGIDLRSIKHKGTGDVNIIGATSHGLVVTAEGKGKIGISGRVDVKDISASGETCVFIASAVGSAPSIYVYDDARVGINGSVGTLSAHTTRTSRLMARHLSTQNAYVEAAGESHMNVTASNKIFATARDYGSIYYYGDPAILTGFEKNSGTIIKMGPVRADKQSSASAYVPHYTRRYTPQHPSRHAARYTPRPAVSASQEPGFKMGASEQQTSPPRFGWRKGQLVQLSDDQKYV